MSDAMTIQELRNALQVLLDSCTFRDLDGADGKWKEYLCLPDRKAISEARKIMEFDNERK